MALKAYSQTKDGSKKLSANFTVKEFRCKDGTDPIFIDDTLVKLLQNIRDHFGKSVTITSAYRTATHNKAVKGATIQSALLRHGGGYSGAGCGRGNGCGLRRDAAEKYRRHGYTPDWLDWVINEKTLNWIVQIVFNFTKKKLEDYMAKKSAETTTVARFGKAGEENKNRKE